MIYVYAVIERADAPLPRVSGINGCAVELTHGGSIDAAISRHPPGSVASRPEDVWRHEAVVEALMRDRAVLPARFRTTFADETVLLGVLAAQAERLTAGLGRVRGCVELGLRVFRKAATGDGEVAIPPEPAPEAAGVAPPPERGAGRAYMTAKLAAERRSRASREGAERIAAEIHAALMPAAREGVRHPSPAPAGPLMTAAYLVPRDRVDGFAEAVRRLAAAHPELRLLCTGPWPPYNFVPALAAPEVCHA